MRRTEQLLLQTHAGVDYTRVVPLSGYRSYDSMETFLDRELHPVQLDGTREYAEYFAPSAATPLSLSARRRSRVIQIMRSLSARNCTRTSDTFARDGVLTIPTSLLDYRWTRFLAQ